MIIIEFKSFKVSKTSLLNTLAIIMVESKSRYININFSEYFLLKKLIILFRYIIAKSDFYIFLDII